MSEEILNNIENIDNNIILGSEGQEIVETGIYYRLYAGASENNRNNLFIGSSYYANPFQNNVSNPGLIETGTSIGYLYSKALVNNAIIRDTSTNKYTFAHDSSHRGELFSTQSYYTVYNEDTINTNYSDPTYFTLINNATTTTNILSHIETTTITSPEWIKYIYMYLINTSPVTINIYVVNGTIDGYIYNYYTYLGFPSPIATITTSYHTIINSNTMACYFMQTNVNRLITDIYFQSSITNKTRAAFYNNDASTADVRNILTSTGYNLNNAYDYSTINNGPYNIWIVTEYDPNLNPNYKSYTLNDIKNIISNNSVFGTDSTWVFPIEYTTSPYNQKLINYDNIENINVINKNSAINSNLTYFPLLSVTTYDNIHLVNNTDAAKIILNYYNSKITVDASFAGNLTIFEGYVNLSYHINDDTVLGLPYTLNVIFTKFSYSSGFYNTIINDLPSNIISFSKTSLTRDTTQNIMLSGGDNIYTSSSPIEDYNKTTINNLNNNNPTGYYIYPFAWVETTAGKKYIIQTSAPDESSNLKLINDITLFYSVNLLYLI